jgi:hypothetical protein
MLDVSSKGRLVMLYTVAVVLILAWLLGVVGMYSIGPLVHLLLVVAVVMFLIRLLNGRRAV